jgi:penicillin-binding protein 1A
MGRARSWVKALLQAAGIALLLAALAPVAVLAVWLRDVPPLRALADLQPATASIVVSRDGEPLAEFSTEYRELASIREIPELVVSSLRAAEDWDFYRHFGVDLQGIVRALLTNVRSGRITQGGSTITQQLTKVLLLSNERTLRRKVLELVLALEIEKTYTKDQIVELYLNTVYFGQGAYGIKTAAEVYFSKDPSELNVPEAALLAGLIRAPSQYDPVPFPDRARERRDVILTRMLQRGVIDAAQYETAVASPLGLRMRPAPEIVALDFTEAVRRELVQSVGAERLYSGGLRIETTLHPEIQKIAEAALIRGIETVEKRLGGRRKDRGPLQGAALVLDTDSGDVLAMVGGREQQGDAHRFNRAVQARRQPGSLFKPFIYTAAIDNGMTPQSVVEDVPVELIDHRGTVKWAPQNYTDRHYGPTTIEEALVHSRNIVAVRLFQSLGMDVVLAYARNMGITSDLPLYPSLALGAGELTLHELVVAYSVYATGGIRVDPRIIRLVTNRRGGLVLQSSPERRRVLSERTASTVASILHSAVQRGTGTAAAVKGVWIAGKTGTTNDSSDAWFVGVAPPLTIGVWLGFDERRQMGRETGGRAAAPIFREIVDKAREHIELRQPPGSSSALPASGGAGSERSVDEEAGAEGV